MNSSQQLLPEPQELVRKWQEENHEWFKRDIAEIVEDFAKWMLARTTPPEQEVERMPSEAEVREWFMNSDDLYPDESGIVAPVGWTSVSDADSTTPEQEAERVARAMFDDMLGVLRSLRPAQSSGKADTRLNKAITLVSDELRALLAQEGRK